MWQLTLENGTDLSDHNKQSLLASDWISNLKDCKVLLNETAAMKTEEIDA